MVNSTRSGFLFSRKKSFSTPHICVFLCLQDHLRFSLAWTGWCTFFGEKRTHKAVLVPDLSLAHWPWHTPAICLCLQPTHVFYAATWMLKKKSAWPRKQNHHTACFPAKSVKSKLEAIWSNLKQWFAGADFYQRAWAERFWFLGRTPPASTCTLTPKWYELGLMLQLRLDKYGLSRATKNWHWWDYSFCS